MERWRALREQIKPLELEADEVKRELEYLSQLKVFRQLVDTAEKGMHYLVNLEGLSRKNRIPDGCFYDEVEDSSAAEANDAIFANASEIPVDGQALYKELRAKFRFLCATVTYNYGTKERVTITQMEDGDYEVEYTGFERTPPEGVDAKATSVVFYKAGDHDCDDIDNWDCNSSDGCVGSSDRERESYDVWLTLK